MPTYNLQININIFLKQCSFVFSPYISARANQEAKIFLLWEKAIFLLLRQVRYGGNFAGIVPHLTTLAASMARFGEDKATEGILGVIGLGKKSSYSHQ